MLRVVAVQTAIVAVAVRATTESERQQLPMVGRVTHAYVYIICIPCLYGVAQ